MHLILLAAITAVCAEPFHREYLPPATCCKNAGIRKTLFRTAAFDESIQRVPAGGYTNDFQGVVVDADDFGSSRTVPGFESALGRPRESYGSTNSKVGEAAFKTTFGIQNDGVVGPGTRIAPGFESIISGAEDGSNDFKIGEASYKLAPGFGTNEFLKLNTELGGDENLGVDKQADEVNSDDNNQFNFEYQTNSGVVGENGVNINGIKDEGSSSFQGEKDKLAHTIDKGGLKPYGVPTATPVSVEIIKSVEESVRNEAAGAVQGGSYESQKHNDGSSENLSHNSDSHRGSIHGSIGTINHGAQFSNKFGTSSQLPSPAPPLNFLIQDGEQQHEEQSLVDANPNAQTASSSFASAFASSGFIKPQVQIIDGKYTSSTIKPHAVQAIDNSYHYHKPSKPFVIPVTPNYGSIENTKFGNPVSTSTLQKIENESNSKPTQDQSNTSQGTSQNQNSESQSSQFNTGFGNTQVQFGQTQSFKPSIFQNNAKETVTSQFTSETQSFKPQFEQTLQTTAENTQTLDTEFKEDTQFDVQSLIQKIENKFGTQQVQVNSGETKFGISQSTSGEIQSELKPTNQPGLITDQNDQFQLQVTKGDKAQTEISNSQSSYSQTSNSQTSLQANSPIIGSVTQQSAISQTEVNESSTKPHFQFQFQPSQSVISGQATSASNKNKFGLTSFGAQFKPFSSESPQTLGEVYEYKKPIVTLTSDKENIVASGLISETSKIPSGVVQTSSTANQQVKPPEFSSSSQENAQGGDTQQNNVGILSTKPQIDQISFEKQIIGQKPALGQLTQTNTETFNTQSIQNTQFGVVPSKSQTPTTEFTSQPSKDTFEQTSFNTTQNKYGLTQFGTQKFNPSLGQAQQSTGEVYKYKKPTESLAINKDNTFSGQTNQTQSQITQVNKIEVVPLQTVTASTQTLNNPNIPVSTFQSNSQVTKLNFTQPNLGSQTSKPTFGQINSGTVGTQSGVTAVQHKFSQTPFISKPFGQSTFGTTQNKYGLTQFGVQQFKAPSTQSQQATSGLYEYKKPGQSLTTNQDANKFTGQFSQTQTGVTQISQTSENAPQVQPIPLQTGTTSTQTINVQNAPTSAFQTSSQFAKPQFGQPNFGSQTSKPTFGQTGLTNSATAGNQSGVGTVQSLVPQTPFVSQPGKFTFGQSTFGTTQNKFGLTQFGAQQFKAPSFQSQQSTGGLYEYKKPSQSLTTNQDANKLTGQVSQSQTTQTSQTSLSSEKATQVQPNPLQTGTATTQTINAQIVPTSAFQTYTQFAKPQFGQPNLGSQTSKITFGQINSGTAGAQSGVTAVKPQFSQTPFVSQLAKAPTFGQPTFGVTQNKYGLTQFGAQQFKAPSSQPQQTTGELYEYKKPSQTIITNQDAIKHTGQVSQILTEVTQISQTSLSKEKATKVQPIPLQTGTTSTQTVKVQNAPTSAFQTSSQFAKPQFGQPNFGSQTSKPTFGQTSQTNSATAGNQSGVGTVQSLVPQTPFVSQPGKFTFGQSTFGTTQNKYGLTQLGAQQFKAPSFQSQQSTGGLYEYKKPSQSLTTNQESNKLTGQVSQTQTTPISQTSLSIDKATQVESKPFQTATAQTNKAQNTPSSAFQTSSQFAKPQFGQPSFVSQTSKPVFGQIGQTISGTAGTESGVSSLQTQVSNTPFISKPNTLTFGQSSFGTAQNKYNSTESGVQQIETSSSQSQKTTGELYEYNRPAQSLSINQTVSKLTEQVSQIQTPVSQVSQATLTKPIPLKTGTISTQTIGVQSIPASVFQTSSQLANSQTGQANLGLQSNNVITGSQITQEAQLGEVSGNLQNIQSQSNSQANIGTLDQTEIGSTQNRFGQSDTGKLMLTSSESNGEIKINKINPIESIIPNQNNGALGSTEAENSQLSQTQFITQQKEIQNSFTNYGSKPENKFGQTQSGTSQPTTGLNQQYFDRLYVYNKPSISSNPIKNSANKGIVTQTAQSSNSDGVGSITTGTQQVFQTQIKGQSQSTSNLQIVQPTKLETTETQFGNIESSQAETQIGADAGKPNVSIIQATAEKSELLSQVNLGFGSTKPASETEFDQTQIGIENNMPKKETAAISTGQISQINDQAQIISQTQSTESQTSQSSLTAQSKKPYVEQSQIKVEKDKPSLDISAIVENTNSQAQIGGQSAKPILCQNSLIGENHQASSHVPGGLINQQATTSNSHYEQINIQSTKPTVSENAFGNTQSTSSSSFEHQIPQFGFGQTHNHHFPQFHHQQDYSYPHGFPHFHGYPQRNDYTHFHNFPHRHDYNHHYGGPGGFGSHYHDFGSQFGYKFDKPFNHYDHNHQESIRFRQNGPQFGQFDSGFWNKNQKFPNYFGGTSSNTVASASVGQPNPETTSQSQFNLNPTLKPSIEKVQETFGTASLISSQNSNTREQAKPIFSGATSGLSQIGETVKPTVTSTGIKDENIPNKSQILSSLSETQVGSSNSQISNLGSLTQVGSKTDIRGGTPSSVPFGKPALHKFGGSLTNSNAATSQSIPNFQLDNKELSNAVTQSSVEPGSIHFEGPLKHTNPYTSNAVATAQSGNPFGQPSSASATASTGPSKFDVNGGNHQPFSTFNGYTSNAEAKAISEPQFGVNSAKTNFGTPSFSNAFASASKDGAFASSFVSSTPVTTTIFGSESASLKTNDHYKLSTPSFREIDTAKPIVSPGSFSQFNVDKGELFGGPQISPKFHHSTGYHY